METLRSPSLGMLGHDIVLQRPKIGKKWIGLNRYISVSTDIVEKGLWFLNTLSTTFLLVMLVYPGLDTIFTLKSLNVQTSNFEQLQIIGRTRSSLKLECHV